MKVNEWRLRELVPREFADEGFIRSTGSQNTFDSRFKELPILSLC